jgi:hypothetical protein
MGCDAAKVRVQSATLVSDCVLQHDPLMFISCVVISYIMLFLIVSVSGDWHHLWRAFGARHASAG